MRTSSPRKIDFLNNLLNECLSELGITEENRVEALLDTIKKVSESNADETKETFRNLIIYCQRDEEFANLNFGQQHAVRHSGCLIVALANALKRYDQRITPQFLIEKCKFNKTGDLIWKSLLEVLRELINSPYLNQFVDVNRSHIGSDFLFNFNPSVNKIYILELDGITNPQGSHWVCLEAIDISLSKEIVAISDPYSGEVRLIKLNSIKGYAYITFPVL